MEKLSKLIKVIFVLLVLNTLIACQNATWFPKQDPDFPQPPPREAFHDTSWNNNQYSKYFGNDTPYQEQNGKIRFPTIKMPKTR